MKSQKVSAPKPTKSSPAKTAAKHLPITATGKSKEKFDPAKKAKKAIYNARQRCTNAKSPDYPAYGGKGIKMLISLPQLLEDIGLPPSEKHSLDRIDPKGHYAVGNVRWTTAIVQAANKQKSPYAHHMSLAAIVDAAKAVKSERAERQDTARAFGIVVGVYNRGYILKPEAQALLSARLSAGVLEATSDYRSLRDCGGAPGVFHLPSLSWPRQRIRMRGDIDQAVPDADETLRRGVVWSADLASNLPPAFLKHVEMDVFSDNSLGAIWVGQPSLENLKGGWIEGQMMAVAATLGRKHSVAFYPALTALEVLAELGGPYTWSAISHQILDARYVFIPDFALDCGDWGELEPRQWWVLQDLVRYRIDRGAKTFIGVQNANAMPRKLRDLLFSELELREMPKSQQTHPAPAEFPPLEDDEKWQEHFSQYPGLDLSPLWNSGGLYRRLVLPSGFVSE